MVNSHGLVNSVTIALAKQDMAQPAVILPGETIHRAAYRPRAIPFRL